MERQNVRVLHQLVKRAEIPLVAAIGARRIAEQRFDSQRLKAFLQTPAHVADAHDPDGTVGQRKTVTLGQHEQRGKHIFHHRDSVAARRRGKTDSRLL